MASVRKSGALRGEVEGPAIFTATVDEERVIDERSRLIDYELRRGRVEELCPGRAPDSGP